MDAAIRKALEKLPADRFTSAQDFAKALADPGFRHGEEEAEAVTAVVVGPWNRLTVIGWGVAAIFALGFGWSLMRPSAPKPVSRYSFGLPVTQRGDGLGSNVAVSPDGARIVYQGLGEGAPQLWLRQRDQLQATPMAGTEGAMNPVFSPDGQRVAFRTDDNDGVSVVSLAGEPAAAITESGVGV